MKALTVLATLALAATPFSQMYGQMRDNQDKQMTCDSGGSGNRARHCEIREQTTGAMGILSVDPGQNGGATVRGWSRNEVLVRSRIDAWADNDTDARTAAAQVYVNTSGGHVQAQGPRSSGDTGWSVSFEIFVPQSTNLTLKTVNGGITVSDIRGSLRFEATNGGVNLARLAGDVDGSTVNGGISLELAGTTWDGSQVQVTTRNGGINVSVPANYSARFQTETVNGSLRSEFPLTLSGDLRSGSQAFSIGAGGPLIHVATTNGAVRLKKV